MFTQCYTSRPYKQQEGASEIKKKQRKISLK